jgi:hypothetical protein
MFKHDLKAAVKINATNRPGTIHARSEYSRGEPNQYYVEYVSGTGDLTSMWFCEDQLSSAVTEVE